MKATRQKNKAQQNISGNQKKSHVPLRLNILFFIVFILFIALIVQLAFLQIVHTDTFQTKINASTKKTVQVNAPRGMIYDASGKALVSNKVNQSIIFTRSAGMDAEDLLKIAQRLNKLIDMPVEKLTERDKKDYWLADKQHYLAAEKRLRPSDKVDSHGDRYSEADIYAKVVKKVKASEINFDEQTLKTATIFKKLNGAYALTPTYIKNHGVTDKEIAIVGEHTTELPGISTGMDWERSYPYGDTMKTILGTVSSEKAGLPADEVDRYLTEGYARNDRVGISYLEKQYESVLRGTKSQEEITLNKAQEIKNQTSVYEGEKGDNLVLTINLEFQQKVNEILRRNYQDLINNGNAVHSPGAYVVVTNPNNGEILALAGINHDLKTGEISDDTLGTINKVFVPGSVVKGATIMSGFENKVINHNSVLVDEPIQIGGGSAKTSVFNPYGQVPITPIQALEFSSNVYMMKIAMKMMGVEYKPGMVLPAKTSVFSKLRATYNEFGLGTETGVDLPGEAPGFINKTYRDSNGDLIPGIMGNLLDLSYGNYDSYSPIQLAQYVSTIANGGKRIAPRIVKGVYATADDGSLGALKQMFKPKVLNQIKGSKDDLAVIQQGFYEVVNGTDYRRTGSSLQGSAYTVAAKTGTAETFAENPKDPSKPIPVVNSTLVSYGPYDNPKIALSVVLPQILNESDHKNTLIAKEIYDAYAEIVDK